MAMAQWAAKNGIDVRILSDCNTVFISHMLAAARVSAAVAHVITNFASFCRVSTAVQVLPGLCL
jgi:Putative Phosphatase